MIRDWIEARAWQVGTVAASVAAVTLGGCAAVLVFQKAGLERDVARMETRLETLRGDLDTCRRNTRDLSGAIEQQNAEIKRISDEGVTRLSAATVAVNEARAATAAVQSRLNRLLNAPATGGTVCERLDEVDRAVLESLK